MDEGWKFHMLLSDGEIYLAMQEYTKGIIEVLMKETDMVVTDGDELACLLRYNCKKDRAPRILAMTDDESEANIFIHTAQQRDVYVSNYPPLMRMLYANTEIGEEIRQELFQAVADELAKTKKYERGQL